MTITFNDHPMKLAQSLTLSALLNQLYAHTAGSALAVNNTIIPRPCWPEYQVQDGDDILLFEVIAGG
ncbi:sulfur carrier protein ThiS [Candidatus Palibaumannia cicadellinicola]|uniref:Sulfur carrier protein ThiS n=1 Tax=Candidatus Palibaumannia cicadellinicola TaxID=186490 RepID=A0A2N4XX42_9GAMM|nr:sulfur carrier protein ThiS [Candidatus Baumannia cicadellinicola]PLK58850.1 sulfur carrier protein ThiS [Candidatus Baumannia cicadellinicola]